MDKYYLSQQFHLALLKTIVQFRQPDTAALSVFANTQIRFKADVLDQIDSFLDTHPDADIPRNDITVSYEKTEVVGGDIPILYIGTEETGENLYPHVGTVLYHIIRRERNLQQGGFLHRSIPYNPIIERLCTFMTEKAMTGSITDPSYTANIHDAVKEVQRDSEDLKDHNLAVGRDASQIAYGLMFHNFQDQISERFGQGLFDMKVPFGDERAMRDRLNQYKGRRVSLHPQARTVTVNSLPETLTHSIRINHRYEDSDDESSIGWFAKSEAKAVYTRELEQTIEDRKRASGALDSFILTSEKREDDYDLKIKMMSAKAIATVKLGYDVEVVYFG